MDKKTVRPEYFTKDMSINNYIAMTLLYAGFLPDNTAMRNVLLSVFEEGARWQREKSPVECTIVSMAEQPAQTPVAVYRAGQHREDPYHVQFLTHMEGDEVFLYTSPQPSKPWVGLTEEERHACTQSPFSADNYRAIEAKLREKNA